MSEKKRGLDEASGGFRWATAKRPIEEKRRMRNMDKNKRNLSRVFRNELLEAFVADVETIKEEVPWEGIQSVRASVTDDGRAIVDVSKRFSSFLDFLSRLHVVLQLRPSDWSPCVGFVSKARQSRRALVVCLYGGRDGCMGRMRLSAGVRHFWLSVTKDEEGDRYWTAQVY